MPWSSHHSIATCRSSSCLNRFQASHKLYSASKRLKRRKAPAPRMAPRKSLRSRGSLRDSAKRSMIAHSWTSNLSGRAKYRSHSCCRMLRPSSTASRCQAGRSSREVSGSSARSRSNSSLVIEWTWPVSTSRKDEVESSASSECLNDRVELHFSSHVKPSLPPFLLNGSLGEVM